MYVQVPVGGTMHIHMFVHVCRGGRDNLTIIFGDDIYLH